MTWVLIGDEGDAGLKGSTTTVRSLVGEDGGDFAGVGGGGGGRRLGESTFDDFELLFCWMLLMLLLFVFSFFSEMNPYNASNIVCACNIYRSSSAY